MEPTTADFIEHLVQVFDEARRVLRTDGTLWLNLGDSYATQATDGLKAKDLMGIPWRVALALQSAGWYLRSDIIWSKNNSMPEAVKDRCTKAHEYIFHFAHPESKGSYFYDQDAIREKSAESGFAKQRAKGVNTWDYGRSGLEKSRPGGMSGKETFQVTGYRNKRSVWKVNNKPYKGAHFACWPEKLVEPMIKAGSSQHGCCSACGAPWVRQTANETYRDISGTRDMNKTQLNVVRAGWRKRSPQSTTLGWEPSCKCEADVVPCTVLDPFSGSATTGCVALQHGRNYIGIDLSSEYLPLALARLEGRAAPEAQLEEEPEDGSILDLFQVD